MAELFTRTATTLGGVFAADTVVVTFGSGISTALVQNMQITYSQNVTRLYEIGLNPAGGSSTYYVGGRTQGQLSLGRIIGPAVTLAAFYATFGNVCSARTNTLGFGLVNPDCSFVGPSLPGAGTMTYTCMFCVITQLGISVQAQDMIINESSTLMFGALDTGP